jgi:hypothetical protein
MLMAGKINQRWKKMISRQDFSHDLKNVISRWLMTGSCDGRTNKDKWARPAKKICRNHHRCNRGHAKGYCGIQGRSK